MLKRLRAAHPILYCILAEVLFLGSLFLSRWGVLGLISPAGLIFVSALSCCWWGQGPPGFGGAAPGGRDCWAAAAAAFGTGCWWECTRWHSSATAYTAH